MNHEIHKNREQRTEEVRDIIDRMPQGIGKFVTLIVSGFAALLLILGLMIDYPEKVTGSIAITARLAPVRLVSNTSGKLHLLKNNNDLLRENQIVACLDNPARLEDVLTVENFLLHNSSDSLCSMPVFNALTTDKVLGELSLPYYTFLNSLQKQFNYKEGKPYDKKVECAKMLLNSQLKLMELALKQMGSNATSLKLVGKNLHRDSMLFRSSTIAEADLERSAVNYLGMAENNQATSK